MKKNTIPRTAIAFAAGGILAIGGPLAASAHVHVTPDAAEAGDYSLLTFRVPNESGTASTVGVTVALPTDTPLVSVSVQPVAGWTAVVATSSLPEAVMIGNTEVTEAPTSVTWTADDSGGIGPQEFQQFAISVGPVPDAELIVLPVEQTYSDGEVVAWDQPTPASGEEPEFPAPTVYINAEAADHHGEAAEAEEADHAESATGSATSDPLARGIGVAGLALGALAAILAGISLFGRSKTSKQS